jgi:thiol:disulfide interchange protein DsbA
MMKKLGIWVLTTVLLSFAFVSAYAAGESFVAGKDYRVIRTAQKGNLPRHSKVEVIEFFSYGCPGCYAFEPYLEKWAATREKDVYVKRVPVVFHAEWLPLAKAYYIAEGLGIERKITPQIFNAIHVKHQDLTNMTNLANIFASNGIKIEQFNNAYRFSPVVDAQVTQGTDLMKTYQVNLIPTVIVGGQYETDMELAQNDPKRFVLIMNYLTKKVQLK